MDEHTCTDQAGNRVGEEPAACATASERERRWRELLADGAAGLGMSLGVFRGLP